LANLEDLESDIEEGMFTWSVNPGQESAKSWRQLVDSLNLDYKVPPELSTILSSKIMDQYKQRFHELFFLLLTRCRLENLFNKMESVKHQDKIQAFADYQWTSQLMHVFYLHQNEDTSLNDCRIIQTPLVNCSL
jgi:hypothetical protein